MRNARSWRVSAREWNRYEDRARSGAAERRGAGFQPLAVLAQLGLLALMALASPSALWSPLCAAVALWQAWLGWRLQLDAALLRALDSAGTLEELDLSLSRLFGRDWPVARWKRGSAAWPVAARLPVGDRPVLAAGPGRVVGGADVNNKKIQV